MTRPVTGWEEVDRAASARLRQERETECYVMHRVFSLDRALGRAQDCAVPDLPSRWVEAFARVTGSTYWWRLLTEDVLWLARDMARARNAMNAAPVAAGRTP